MIEEDANALIFRGVGVGGDIAVPPRFTLQGIRGGCAQVLQELTGCCVLDADFFFFIIVATDAAMAVSLSSSTQSDVM